MNTEFKVAEILLVEDNLDDVRLTMETLKENKMFNNINIVNDGEDAIAFLRQEGKYSNVLRPDLILLDLNLPKKNGHEVLADIKNDEKLKRIPVVILTNSKVEEDILKSYDLYANCYITKPIDFVQFTKIVKAIDQFWLGIVALPKE